MATGNSKSDDASGATLDRIADTLDSISRQLDVAVKLSLREHQGERKPIDMIRLLGSLGCSTADIANWLGAPITSVGPILSRMKSEKKTGAAKRSKGSRNA
jgi:hypothetical protein